MPDVATNEVLIESDGGGEVASCPQGLLFVQTAHSLDLLLEPGGRLPLQCLHDVRDGIPRCREDTEVNVVVLNVKFDHLPMFPFADGLEYSFQFTFDLFVREHFSSVLRRPY